VLGRFFREERKIAQWKRQTTAGMSCYAEIAKKIQSEAVTVFLIHETTYDAYSSKLKNFKSHSLNYNLITPAVTLQQQSGAYQTALPCFRGYRFWP
jgi:hypothetical protein